MDFEKDSHGYGCTETVISSNGVPNLIGPYKMNVKQTRRYIHVMYNERLKLPESIILLSHLICSYDEA